MEARLVFQPMLPTHIAMVAHKNDGGVVKNTVLPEPGIYSCKLVIYTRHKPIVFCPVTCGGLGFPGRHGRRQLDVLGRVHIEIWLYRHINGRMRYSVAYHGHKRTVIPYHPAHKLQQVAGLILRLKASAGAWRPVVISVKNTVYVMMPPTIAYKLVKAEPVFSRDIIELAPTIEMPFAYPGCFITPGLYSLRQKRPWPIQVYRIVISTHPDTVCIRAAH